MMAIERDSILRFHPKGTLNSVTRWISWHDEGLAEWLKNARRAYQIDRGNVAEKHRSAVLLISDGTASDAARIGLLDVGGATLEDVDKWSVWQDPEASRRSLDLNEEQTQGNGGKAYMFRLFKGPARIFGVRDGKRNCKGLVGEQGSEERGTPGFIPDSVVGRDIPISSVLVELGQVLVHYSLTPDDLPREVKKAIEERQAFTIVEGIDPTALGRAIDFDDLLAKLLRHEQSTLAIQQLKLFAIHNGRVLNSGKPLQPPPIDPYPGLEGPFPCEIPEELALADDQNGFHDRERRTRPGTSYSLHF